VTVSNGEVILDGTVAERFAKRPAEDIAAGASGVMRVQDNLRVRDQSTGMGASDMTTGSGGTGKGTGTRLGATGTGAGSKGTPTSGTSTSTTGTGRD
jgi:hypothetical protein